MTALAGIARPDVWLLPGISSLFRIPGLLIQYRGTDWTPYLYSFLLLLTSRAIAMPRYAVRKYARGNVVEFPVAEIEKLIQQGKIEREGAWYQINDLKVLHNELFGLVKKMLVNKQKTMVQLNS